MTVQIALVGAGAMASLVARDIYPALTDQVRVVAVVDRDRARAEALAGPLGASAAESLSEVWPLQLDGVDVRLPHAAHRDAVLEALEHDVHVLVEKPLAVSVRAATDIVEAAERTTRTVAVSENYPHLRAVRAAGRALAAGAVGEVLALRTTRAYTLEGVWATPWRRDGREQSGVLWDQGTHHTSLLRTLAGEIVAVSAARSRGRATPGVESVVLTLILASGLAAQSAYVWGTPAVPVETEALVLGTTGRLHIDVDYDGSDGLARRIGPDGEGELLSEPECYYDSHRWIVEDWLDAVRTGRPPMVGPADALEDVLVVAAAHRSLERGGALVELEEERMACNGI